MQGLRIFCVIFHYGLKGPEWSARSCSQVITFCLDAVCLLSSRARKILSGHIHYFRTPHRIRTTSLDPQLAIHLRARHTVSACLPALRPFAHLGVKIVLDHMGRLARLFIKNLTPFFCSVRRSIYLANQLCTHLMYKNTGSRLTMQRDRILLRVRIQDFVKPVLYYISWLGQNARS